MKKLILFGAACAVLFSVFSCTKGDISSFMTVTGERAEIDLDKAFSSADVHDAIASGTESGVKYYYLKGDYSKLGIDGQGSNPFAGSTAETIDFSGVYGWDELHVLWDFIDDEYKDEAVTFSGAGFREGAFRNTLSEFACLRRVILPESVTVLSEGVFYGCPSLVSVEASGAKVIDMEAFSGCASLRNISCPDVEMIGPLVFQGCESLTEVEMPLLEYAASNAFSGSFLVKAYFPCLKDMGSRNGSVAFNDCPKLESIDLPSLETVRTGAITGCPSLSQVSLSGVKRVEKCFISNLDSDIKTGLRRLELSSEGDIDVAENAFEWIDTENCTLVLNKDKMPGGGASPEADSENGIWAGEQWKEIVFE